MRFDRRLVESGDPRNLVCRFVVAGLPAGRTVVEAILAEANVDLALAETAVLFALAALLTHITLRAHELGFAEAAGDRFSRRHDGTVAPEMLPAKFR
jgi:hypothetical protein